MHALAIAALLASQDPKRVDAAIDKGVQYLKAAPSPPAPNGSRTDDLILLTLLHAGLPESDPAFRRYFKSVTEAKLERTYDVSLQAMALEELDRVKYQARIHQCAQFLADNQCANGQWSYGTPTAHSEPVPVPTPTVTRNVATTSKRPKGIVDFDAPPVGPRPKPRVVTYLRVTKTREGPAGGDNSNSQYAALGIRACHDAGIVFPKELVERARKWWVDNQEKTADKDKGAVATGLAAEPRGWNYHPTAFATISGSMTAGAVGSVVIYDSMLGQDWKKDKTVQGGLAWMAQNFSVTDNPRLGNVAYYYYLYAVERLGILYDTRKIGTHDWYAEGAKAILEAQRADGSWDVSGFSSGNHAAWDTCFAILFLKRATRPLQDVASVDRFNAQGGK